MITTVTVGKGWHRFAGKDEGPEIEPGEYFRVQVHKPADEFKKRYGLIAAVPSPDSRMGRFCWLAPKEQWVVRSMLGFIVPKIDLSLVQVDWSLFPVKPEQLRPWQIDFVKRMFAYVSSGKRFGMAEVVNLGGGKTLAGLLALAVADNGVVVAPRHVHETWMSEAEKWGFQTPTCTTYESAYKFADLRPDVVVCDEVHKCKDSESARHQHVIKLAEHAQVVVGFTASLLGGRGPLDLQSLRVIEPGCVPANDTAWRFLFGLDTRLEEVAPGRKAYVTKTWDTEKIARFVEPYVDTVDLSSLIASLPPLTETIIKLPTPKDYELVSRGGSTTRSKSKRTAQLRQCTDGFVEMDDGTIVRLNSDKLKWIGEFVDHLNEPVVIYAAWRESVRSLVELFKDKRPAVLEGGCGDMAAQVSRFKSGETSVLIANSAFSEGMNLQGVCRTMLFMSLSANPVCLTQAIGRIHRPGQTRGCQIVHLQCEGTIDERAYELVKNHLDLSEDQIEKLLEESA